MNSLPQAEDYKINKEVIFNVQKYKLSYDDKRRCYKLSNPNYGFFSSLFDWIQSWFGKVSSNRKFAYFISGKLQNQECYNEIIGDNHLALDARALDYLCQKKLIINNSNPQISLVKSRDQFSNIHKLYKIPANLQLAETKDYFISIKKPYFSDHYILITDAMKDKLASSAFIIKDQNKNIYTHLSGEKFKLIRSGNNYKLYNTDNNLRQMSTVSDNLTKWLQIFSQEEPYIRKQGNNYLLNQAAYEKHVGNKININSNLTNQFSAVKAKEQAELNQIKAGFSQQEPYKFTEEEFEELSKGRIWLDNQGELHACIDKDNEVFISSAGNTNQDKLPIQAYLKGEAALRRKEPYALAAIPTWRRRMKFHNSEDKSGPTIIIDGGDDTATALTSSGLPQKTALALQSFLIFPAFLSMVNIGVQGLLGESEESKAELTDIQQKIFHCANQIKELNAQTQIAKKTSGPLLEEDKKELTEQVAKCYEAVNDLKDEIEEKNQQIFANKTANTGYVAMLNMFSAVTAYQMSSFIKFIDSFQANPTNLAMETSNIFDLVGQSTAGIGQLLMTCFAAAKSYDATNELGKIDQDLENIKNSPILNKLAKNIMTAYKKDEKFFQKTQIVGNATLSAGQATMFAGGVAAISPLTYAGLAATLGGVAVNTAGTLWHQKLYGHDEEPDELETKIREKNNQRLFDCLIEKSTKNNANESLSISNIYKENICNMELLSALKATSIVANQIFAGGYKKKNINSLLATYKKNPHQRGFYTLLNSLTAKETQYLSCQKDDATNYNLTWQTQLEKLNKLEESDINWITELSKNLSNYQAGDRLDINNDSIPAAIKTEIDSFNNSNNKNYDNLITAIQRGYMQEKLSDKQSPSSDSTNNNTPAQQLTNKMYEDKAFTQKLMQHEYSKNNPGSLNIFGSGDKSKGLYNGNSKPIKIIGKVNKEGGGLFHTTPKHKKNVYILNNDKSFKESYQLDNDFVANYTATDHQYRLRSDYHRYIHNMIDNVNKEQEQRSCEEETKKSMDSIKKLIECSQNSSVEKSEF